MTPATERLHYMDSLRAVAMFLGLVLHAAVLFEMWVFDPCRVHDQPSPSLHYVAEMIHVFRMELFFLVAGFFSALVCVRRGAIRYAQNRVQRILIPFVLCVLFLLPLTASISWVDMEDSGQTIGSKFLECFFDPSYIYTQNGPMGNWFWHFWFLHLLCYFMAAYLLLRLIVSKLNLINGLCHSFLAALSRPYGLLILVAMTFGVLIFSPPWADVPRIGTSLDVLTYYGIFFFTGVLLNARPNVLDDLARNFKYYAVPFAVSLVILIPLIDRITLTSPPELFLQDWSLFVGVADRAELVGSIPFLQNPFNFSSFYASPEWFLMCLLRAFCTWSAITGFVLLFRTYFNQPSALGRYAADSSYFIYLVHFPIQLALGRLLRNYIDSSMLCFLICLTISLIICVLLYHFLCRGTVIGKLLSGRTYSLAFHEEWNEIRSFFQQPNCYLYLGGLAVGVTVIGYFEYRPNQELLKISHHAKIERVEEFIHGRSKEELMGIVRHDGRNAIHMAAQSMRLPRPDEDVRQTLSLLLNAGIPVNSLDNFGQSPIHYAVRSGNLAALKTLLDHDANPNIADRVYGNSALHLAATYGSDKMMSALLDAGADPQQTRKNGEDPKKILTRFHKRDWDSIEMD